MVEGWKYWIGKKVYVILKSGRIYQGKIIEVEDRNPLLFLTMIDKLGSRVTFLNSEIDVLQEEK